MTFGFVPHRPSLLSASVVVSALLFSGASHAAPFIPKINEPESYKDIRFGLNEMRENIESVSCGGWTDNSEGQTSGTSVTGGEVPIPDISPDVPGRNNTNPLGRPTTGIGTRGSFEYPGSAFGYLSACDSRQTTMKDKDLEKLGINLKIREDGSVASEPGDGTIDINPFRWCIISDKATPKLCERLFKAWRELSAIAPRPPPDAFCQIPDDAISVPQLQEKFYCFDHDLPGHDYTKTCGGEECRTLQGPEFSNKMTECHFEPAFDGAGNFIGQRPVVDVGPSDSGRPSSFYRHYGNPFSDWEETKEPDQSPLTVKDINGKEWKLRVECYEYYKEVDPKDIVTAKDAEQCEIIIKSENEDSPKSPAWEPGGGHSQKEQFKPDAGDVAEPPRAARQVPEPWIADTETNLNIVDIKKLKEQQKNFDDPADVTAMLGALLTTRQTASKTVPDNARTDQFDDTAERNFAEFWEEQQRELLKMTADPQTRLIMPARFLVGLADNDPIYQYAQQVVSRSDGNVEITLRAGLEDIGNVLKSFQRIFVAPIQEVRIPILVPVASVSEIDARIADWKQWKIDEDRQAEAESRASRSGGADPLIEKLEEYREGAERVRLLRGARDSYLTKLFDSQREIREYFATWYEENAGLLLQAARRFEQRRELIRIWRLAQRSMLITDACQLLWCSNQRYKAPIFSLLDNWWGVRQPGEQRNLQFKPPSLKDLEYEQPKDQLFDFSDMKFPRDPWLVPTLWVVEARLRLPTPPLVGGVPPSPDDFPDLPQLPDAHLFDNFTVPSVSLPEKPRVQLNPTEDLEPAKQLLRDIRKNVLDGIEISKQLEEEEELKQGESIQLEDPSEYLAVARESMLGSYCRFPPSLTAIPDANQERGNASKIIHVENDLKERIAMLFSRYATEWKSDYAGRGARLNEDFPAGSDEPECHEDVICYLMPPEKITTVTWQWFMPGNNGGNFTALADAVKAATLPCPNEQAPCDESKKNPYFNASSQILRRLFPKFTLPVLTELNP